MTIDSRSVSICDDLPKSNGGRTWILRWSGGSSDAMTEEEAYDLACGLRAMSSQSMLDQYQMEAAKPHAGDEFRQFVRSLLIRAADAGIWVDKTRAEILSNWSSFK